MNLDGTVEMCLKHPGYDVDVKVMSDIRRFVETWRGFRSLRREIAASAIRFEGPSVLRRAFPGWLLLSALSTFPRCRDGEERSLASTRKRASSVA